MFAFLEGLEAGLTVGCDCPEERVAASDFDGGPSGARGGGGESG